MLISEQERLKAEVDAYISNRTTAMAKTVWINPVSDYADAAYLAKEEQSLFRRLPLILGHGTELTTPGSYITRDVAGVPVLLVRQQDGSAQAFLNMCRHRGARLADHPAGCERKFVCPYHAWGFNVDGSVAHIPHAEGFEGVDKSTLGLVKLPTQERHGLVWVVLKPEADIDVASFLGNELDTEIASWKLEDMVSERMGVVHENANWKLLVDGFLETYHVAKLHNKSVAPFIRQNMGPFKEFGRHGRLCNVRYRYKEQGQPLDDNFLYGVTGVYLILPNTVLLWHGTHFERYSMFPEPGNPAKTACHINMLVRPETKDNTGKWDKNWELIHGTIVGEDFAMSRAGQAGFAAGIMENVVFGKNEPCLQHYHQQMQIALNEA